MMRNTNHEPSTSCAKAFSSSSSSPALSLHLPNGKPCPTGVRRSKGEASASTKACSSAPHPTEYTVHERFYHLDELPSPFKRNFRLLRILHAEEMHDVQVEIFQANGQQVRSLRLSAPTDDIDLQEVGSGNLLRSLQ